MKSLRGVLFVINWLGYCINSWLKTSSHWNITMKWKIRLNYMILSRLSLTYSKIISLLKIGFLFLLIDSLLYSSYSLMSTWLYSIILSLFFITYTFKKIIFSHQIRLPNSKSMCFFLISDYNNLKHTILLILSPPNNHLSLYLLLQRSSNQYRYRMLTNLLTNQSSLLNSKIIIILRPININILLILGTKRAIHRIKKMTNYLFLSIKILISLQLSLLMINKISLKAKEIKSSL